MLQRYIDAFIQDICCCLEYQSHIRGSCMNIIWQGLKPDVRLSAFLNANVITTKRSFYNNSIVSYKSMYNLFELYMKHFEFVFNWTIFSVFSSTFNFLRITYIILAVIHFVLSDCLWFQSFWVNPILPKVFFGILPRGPYWPNP